MALEDGSRYCYSPAAASDLEPSSPNSFSRNSSTASSPTTICEFTFDPILARPSSFQWLLISPGDVEHKHEVITEDEEADINVDDDDPYDKAFHAKTNSLSKFSFSISNILSDTFGPKPVKLEPNQGSDKNIFRPFEIKNFINSGSSQPKVQNPSSIFLSNFRLSELFDYSTKQASPQIKSDSSSLRNSLYNSLASYPKIQEEILNSHKQNPHHTQPPSNYHSATSKIPPLGGLCKTISQIGQENASLSVLQPRAPSLGVQSKSNSLESINKIQQSSTDSVDSDDCTSEASANKDESQKMWPAWVSVAVRLFTSN